MATECVSTSAVDPVTLVYKTTSDGPNSSSPEGGRSGIPLHLDVYPPGPHFDDTLSGGDGCGVPAVVYFHGGGLVNGNRKSWFTEWLRKRLCEHGIAVLSAEYRLLPPSTGHDIVEDIKDLFNYIQNDLNSALTGTSGGINLRVDIDAIAVAGSSAGGLCTYLCAMHASPKPKAVLSIYGQAGECLNDNFIMPKTKPFIPNQPLDDPSNFTEFIFPQSAFLPTAAGVPVDYSAPTKRMSLSRLYYQLGEWLDYYTGDHTLSRRLRQLRLSSPQVSGAEPPSPAIDPVKAREVIGEENVGLFAQFGVTEDWPPTMFVHGTEDAQVPLYESKHLMEKLKAVGVESELIVVEGQAHAFDVFASDAEKEFGRLFDRASAFLVKSLQK